jgi:uncharacterized protein (DUF983 family)
MLAMSGHTGPSFWLYFGRAMRLRCPECGVSPMFMPVAKTRSIWNWFTPLDGCPRCGYAYERESGYFLLSTWAFNYGVVAGLGVIVALIVDAIFHPSLTVLILSVAIPMPIFSFLFARHAKSLYLAMDHYFDPHHKPKSENSNLRS